MTKQFGRGRLVQRCEVMFTATSSMNAFYTKFINRTLALEGGGLKSLKIGSLEK